jgi:hypothetical protein
MHEDTPQQQTDRLRPWPSIEARGAAQSRCALQPFRKALRPFPAIKDHLEWAHG